MSSKSHIGWTDATWMTVTGCTREDSGCENCFAEILTATRLHENRFYKDLSVVRADGLAHWTNEVRCHTEKLTQPLHWGKGRMIFVNSMSDTFHPAVPDDFIVEMFAIMALCPQHIFQVLTKRIERAAVLMNDLAFVAKIHQRAFMLISERSTGKKRHAALGALNEIGAAPHNWPFKNVRIGCSVSDQASADRRFPVIATVPAYSRFISMEPMIGPILPYDYLHPVCQQCEAVWRPNPNWIYDKSGERIISHHTCGISGMLPGVGRSPIDQIILGGESICGKDTGRRPRPLHSTWVLQWAEICRRYNIAFFFKQMGDWAWVKEMEPEQRALYRRPAPHGGRLVHSERWNKEGIVLHHDGTTCDPDVQTDPELRGELLLLIGKSRAGNVIGGITYEEQPPNDLDVHRDGRYLGLSDGT